MRVCGWCRGTAGVRAREVSAPQRLFKAALRVIDAIEGPFGAVAALRHAVIIIFTLGGIASVRPGSAAAAASFDRVASTTDGKVGDRINRGLLEFFRIGIPHAFIPELKMGIDGAKHIGAHDDNP